MPAFFVCCGVYQFVAVLYNDVGKVGAIQHGI